MAALAQAAHVKIRMIHVINRAVCDIIHFGILKRDTLASRSLTSGPLQCIKVQHAAPHYLSAVMPRTAPFANIHPRPSYPHIDKGPLHMRKT